LLIDVPADELVVRLSGRWICRAAGHVYHEIVNPPTAPGRPFKRSRARGSN